MAKVDNSYGGRGQLKKQGVSLSERRRYGRFSPWYGVSLSDRRRYGCFAPMHFKTPNQLVLTVPKLPISGY